MKKKIRKLICISLIGLLSFSMLYAQSKQLRIAFTHHSSASNVFWQAVKKGMDEACKLVGAKCTMYFTQQEGSVQQQVANMTSIIAQKPDALITTIVDDKALDKVIDRALAQGISVIGANVDDSEGAKGNSRLSFIGQSFNEAGYSLGKKMSEFFPKRGKIKALIGVSAPGQNWAEQRMAGVMRFLEEYKKTSGRDVTWERIDSGTDLAISADRVGAYLAANPDTTVYFDAGFWHASVAKVLIDRKKKPGEILLGGFDIVPEVLRYIKSGYIQVEVDQQPFLQGYLPVIQAHLMKKYKLSAWDVDTGKGLILKENVADVEKLSKSGYR